MLLLLHLCKEVTHCQYFKDLSVPIYTSKTSIHSPWFIQYHLFNMDSAVPHFCMVRVYWAGDNLGKWDEFWYETCPRCMINHSTCWSAVQWTTTVPRLPLSFMQRLLHQCLQYHCYCLLYIWDIGYSHSLTQEFQDLLAGIWKIASMHSSRLLRYYSSQDSTSLLTSPCVVLLPLLTLYMGHSYTQPFCSYM